MSACGKRILVLATLACAPAPGGALAQTSEGYFKGKTVQINIAGTPGGGIDIGARKIGRAHV